MPVSDDRRVVWEEHLAHPVEVVGRLQAIDDRPAHQGDTAPIAFDAIIGSHPPRRHGHTNLNDVPARHSRRRIA